MNIKKIWRNHSFLIFKIVSLLGMIVFFIISGWKGILGFCFGMCYISYLVFTNNPQFNAIVLAVRFKQMGEANNEIFKKEN